MAAASERLANVSVECGGKAPSLVFGDCDLAKAVDALAYGAFLYTGQSCTAATRIIVQRDAYDAFADGVRGARAVAAGGQPAGRGDAGRAARVGPAAGAGAAASSTASPATAARS